MDMSFDRIVGVVGIGLGVLAIAIGVGVAIAMDPRSKGEFEFSIGCFIFSGLVLCFTVGAWGFFTTTSAMKRTLILVPCFAAICISMVEASRWANGRYHRAETITKSDGFTILIPINTANRNMPIPLDENPEDVHSKFYRALTFSITDRDPSKTSGYLMLQQDQLFSEEGRPRFLGKLVLMHIFESVFSMTRESYGVELGGGKLTPLENKSVIPPDVVSSSTDYVIADLSKRQFLNGRIESLLKNFPLHMPKGTNVTFSEHLERESAVYIMRMERPGFFRFDLSVRPFGSSSEGILPNKFQTQAAKTVKTYDLIVAMDSVIQATSADGFEADKYTIWVQDTFTELRRRMTF